MASVYRKTDKGIAEIETRANRLAPRLRTALIMVDGRRSEHDLRALIGGEPEEVLAVLLDQGYVEVIGTVAERPASPPPAAPAPPPPAKTPGFDERRRQAVRFLNDNLGPSAESLVLKIEKARDWDEMKPHLEMAEHFLRSARGASTARDFASKFIEEEA
ncbi:MAG TPA: hypothetical protein VGE16_12815 [Albitalea sp.]